MSNLIFYGDTMKQKLIGRKVWDITPLFVYKPPTPSRILQCPVCSCNVLWFKEAHSFERSPTEFRTDIFLKCDDCGHIILFGVHITKEEYERIPNKRLEYNVTGHVNVNSLVGK